MTFHPARRRSSKWTASKSSWSTWTAQFYAVEDVCTHDGGPLGEGKLDGCELICPRHGARFDVRTGAATRMPAIEPAPTYAVRVEDGDVLVEAF